MVLNKDVDTIFFNTSLEYSYLSSSTVKEAAFYGADISGFVPESVVRPVFYYPVGSYLSYAVKSHQLVF